MDLVLQSGRADRLMLLGLCLTSVRVYKEDQLSVGVDGRSVALHEQLHRLEVCDQIK
jgi:hypothetical protein